MSPLALSLGEARGLATAKPKFRKGGGGQQWQKPRDQRGELQGLEMFAAGEAESRLGWIPGRDWPRVAFAARLSRSRAAEISRLCPARLLNPAAERGA